MEDDYLYGEDIYGVHSIVYEPVPEDETFYVFALRRGATFTDWDAVEAKASDLGIPTVPVLYKGTFESVQEVDAFAKAASESPSALGGDREGVVIRVASAFSADMFTAHVCKSVRPNHVQPGASHWRTHWQPCAIVEPTSLKRS